jgi:hypothetical protein
MPRLHPSVALDLATEILKTLVIPGAHASCGGSVPSVRGAENVARLY